MEKTPRLFKAIRSDKDRNGILGLYRNYKQNGDKKNLLMLRRIMVLAFLYGESPYVDYQEFISRILEWQEGPARRMRCGSLFGRDITKYPEIC